VRLLNGEGVLITGVYGSGKSSVAAEVAYHLEQRGEPYALLDLDYLGWGSSPGGDQWTEFDMMLRNLAAVGSNYREAGIGLFVVAYFVRGLPEVVMQRGQVLVENGEFHGTPGQGRFLPRSRLTA